jgi:1-acyl-sn-glycerol-3-phosphate acyltransferase
MAKGVLGNDPFQRGAASRTPLPVPAEPQQSRPRAATRSKGWKARNRIEGGSADTSNVREVQAAPDLSRDRSQRSSEPTADVTENRGQFLYQAYRVLRAAVGLRRAHVDEFVEDAQLVHDLSPLADFLYDRYWRISVEGASQVPRSSSMLVANHAGALPFDGPMLRLAIARQRADLPEARWLADESILRIPILGPVLRGMGAVRATPENALQLLSVPSPLIVFPEGAHGASKSLKRRYELRPFGRGGFVKIAARAKAPIVPVAIVGPPEAMPVLAKLPIESFGLPYLPLTVPPLPIKWLIRFGEPLDVAVDQDDRSQVAAFAERVRAAVQEMLRQMLTSRRSIFAG